MVREEDAANAEEAAGAGLGIAGTWQINRRSNQYTHSRALLQSCGTGVHGEGREGVVKKVKLYEIKSFPLCDVVWMTGGGGSAGHCHGVIKGGCTIDPGPPSITL